MVSRRQREARKRFKAEHPELFPKPEPTPPKDPTKTKKNKPKFKRTKSDATSKDPKTVDKPHKSKFKKHPLRVPGLKPGESCFICKDKNHIAKNCPKKAEWEKNKICLFCRQRGHSLKNCPNKSEEVAEEKLCYNCGETSHSLSKCPHPIQDGGTKFALCFICKERGHLSKNCPKSTHGIYPKGGCCKICGRVTHLAKDCPDKGRRGLSAVNGGGTSKQEESRPQVTKLLSGDDLEDDFIMEDEDKVKEEPKKTAKAYPIASQANHNQAKVKKKQGPKVVNFVGWTFQL